MDLLRRIGLLRTILGIPKGLISLKQLSRNSQDYFAEKELDNQKRSLPIYLDSDLHWKFKVIKSKFCEQNFVIERKNWFVWGNQGCVITDKNYVFTEASREFGNDLLSVFKQVKLIKPTFYEGRIAVLAASGSNIYYHWMVDVLPRIQLLKDSGYFESVDRFILNYQGLPFQKETLKKIGVEESKIIIANDHFNFHAKIETLIIPSFISPIDIVSKYCINFLRVNFLTTTASKFPDKVYIKRNNGRRIVNELEIESYLKSIGFASVNLEQFSVSEQAGIFNNAKIIVGAHGAGFTNIAFCESNTRVIDIFSPFWVNPCYWTLASELNLDYRYLIGEGERPVDYFDPEGKSNNILVNINKLKQLL